MPARKLALSLCACLLAILGVATGANAATYPSGFEERQLIGGLTIPTGVAWTPDGRAIVIEKSGLVKLALPGASTATTVLDLRAEVNDNHDRGLLGVAVDAQFATHPYVYLLYTHDVGIVPDTNGAMTAQLMRVRLTPDNRMVEPTVILGTEGETVCPETPRNDLDCIPSDYDSHTIGTVLSAPDGTLYVGSGDGASYNWADVRALRSLDERSMAGKIFHIDRNGRGLPGHAFCPSNTNLDDVCAKLHARGFRNPFRFTLRPDGRGLVVGDVGWNTWEEINLVTEAGRSYGWPCYEGSARTPGYRDFAQCQTEYNRPAGTHTDPDHQYCHCGGSASAIGGPVYQGDQYPAGYRGSIFIADYSQRWIKRLELDGAGQIAAVRNFATNWGGVQLATAPNGDLAFPDFGNFSNGSGSIRTIRYVAGNRAPDAHVTADRTSGSAPLTVKFDARGSTDADGDPLTYSWNFGDGTPGSTSATPTHTYTSPGTYTATVTVTDDRGASDQASIVITAGNDAPVAQITAPADRSLYRDGAVVQLSGTGTDAQDGTLPGSALTWRIVLHHADHIHPLTDLTGNNPTFVARDDHDADSFYEITLTVRDSGGLTGSRTIRLDPETVPLSLQSEPAGAVMTWAGLDVTAPHQAPAAIGFRTEVSAAPTLVSGGKTLTFARWSDGVTDRTRQLTVPDQPLSLTAVYEETGPRPVVAFSFDQGSGTTAVDESGNGNNGTIKGASWTEGRFGGALRFDGVDDWVTVTDRAALDLGTSYTLSAWVQPESSNRWQTVLMKETAGTFGYALYATSDSPPPSAWAGATSTYGTGALPRSSWSHLTVTVGGGVQRLYVNGTQVASGPVSGAVATDGAFRIGGNSVWSNEFFKGKIDEVRVYDRTLGADEVRADRDRGIGGGEPAPDPEPPSDAVAAWSFDESSGTVAHDATSNGHDGTVRGATWAPGRYGNGLKFDGVDDWVTVADHDDLDLSSPYTLSAWVRPESRARWQTILLKELGSTLSYALYATSSWDAPSAWNNNNSAYGPRPLPSDTWSHVAVTVSGSTQRLYVDGDLVATSPAEFALEGSGPLRIGGNSIWTEFFTGTIDEVRVYARALSADEIEADRRTPIGDAEPEPGPDPDPDPEPGTGDGPVAAYAFDATSGTTAVDASGNGHTGTVSGATWTTGGRHGGALRFDGVNDWVTVADHPDLDLGGRWTLSAWVRPESTARWSTVILKEADPTLSYALYARSDSTAPSAWTSYSWAYGDAALPNATWSHLTATLDDGTLRFYVNGVLRQTTTAAQAGIQTDEPLRIGGNAVWGEWFTGLIDDVRVYDRALSTAEVQADMETAVPSSPPAGAARAGTARSASTGAPRARAAASAPVAARGSSRGIGRRAKRSIAYRVRPTKTRSRTARTYARAVKRNNRMSRRQKKAAVKKALRRLLARRAAERRRRGLPPILSRREKARAVRLAARAKTKKAASKKGAPKKAAPRKTAARRGAAKAKARGSAPRRGRR